MYVRFNRAWLPYILGSLKQLMLQSTWNTDDPNVLNQQQEYAGQILYEFMIGKNTAPVLGSAGADEGCNLIRQNPDNPCLLETSIDGTNWCAFADLGKCFDTATGQPGADSRQPAAGGGCQSYPLKLQANSKVLVPTVVNAGDSVSFSDIKGAGGDGTLHWYCPNGSIFFAGACVGSFSFNGADPDPSIHHMAVVAKIGSAYYDITAGPITVPGGISNEQIIIQVNDSVLTDNGGEYSLTAEVCNNAAAAWSHLLDFTLAPHGASWNGATSFWTAGIGLSATAIGPNIPLRWRIPLPTNTTITAMEITYNNTDESGGPPENIVRTLDAALAVITNYQVNNALHSSVSETRNIAGNSALTRYIEVNTNTQSTGAITVPKLTVFGNGPEPVWP